MRPPIRSVPSRTLERFRDSFPKLGPRRIETPRGVVDMIDVPGLSCSLVERKDGPNSIALLLYDDVNKLGWLNQMSGASARTVAAALLRLADLADGGATKQ